MKVLKGLLLAAAVTLWGGQALAWTATAISDSYTHTNYNSGSPQEAETNALSECNAKSTNCRLFGQTMNGTAVVLAKGDKGRGRAADLNPRIAAKEALKQCQQVSKNCRVVSAVWDSGATWGAVASGNDNYFGHTNATTKSRAETDALNGCEKNTNKAGSCKILPNFSSDRNAFYSFASSESSKGIGLDDTTQGAKLQSLDSCEKGKTPGTICAVRHIAENRGPTAEPSSMKQLVAEGREFQLKTLTVAENLNPFTKSTATGIKTPFAMPKRCRMETRYESRPFMENVCDYNSYGPTNCRNVQTRLEQIPSNFEVCDY